MLDPDEEHGGHGQRRIQARARSRELVTGGLQIPSLDQGVGFSLNIEVLWM